VHLKSAESARATGRVAGGGMVRFFLRSAVSPGGVIERDEGEEGERVRRERFYSSDADGEVPGFTRRRRIRQHAQLMVHAIADWM